MQYLMTVLVTLGSCLVYMRTVTNLRTVSRYLVHPIQVAAFILFTISVLISRPPTVIHKYSYILIFVDFNAMLVGFS